MIVSEISATKSNMKNVVLIVLDTVRKDFFDEHAKTIRRLADVEFHRCYAPSSWSIPSHASILSGTLPHQHGVHTYNPDYSELGDTVLDDLPHTTIGVSANGAVSDSFGIDEIFDEFHSFSGNNEYSPDALSFKEVEGESNGLKRFLQYVSMARKRRKLARSVFNGAYIKTNNILRKTPLPKIGDAGANAVVKKSISAVTNSNEEPFFLLQNFIDAHEPMENFLSLDSSVPYRWNSNDLDKDDIRKRSPDDLTGYLESHRDLYAANIEYLDDKVSSFVRELQSKTKNDTVFIITADHGEEIYFENEYDVGHMDFSNGLLHVPLVIINSEEAQIHDQVSLLGVRELVTSLVNDDGIPDITGDRIPAERIGMMFYDGDDEYWSRAVRTVYTGDSRYEWDSLGESTKIGVEKSRDESKEAVEIPDSIMDEFDIRLDEYLDQYGESDVVDVSKETMRHLENLGYKV